MVVYKLKKKVPSLGHRRFQRWKWNHSVVLPWIIPGQGTEGSLSGSKRAGHD